MSSQSLPPKDVLHFLQSKVKKIKTIHEAFGDYWHARFDLTGFSADSA